MAHKKYTVASSPQQGSNRPKDRFQPKQPRVNPIPGSMIGPNQSKWGGPKPKPKPKPKPGRKPIIDMPIPGQKGYPGPGKRWPGGVSLNPPALMRSKRKK